MSDKSRRILTVTAVLILVLAIAGIVFVVLDSNGVFDGLKAKKQASETTAAETAVHDDTEYNYNSDGTLASEIYYKDNVFNGRKDYVYFPEKKYTVTYNADNEEIANETYTLNALNNAVTYIAQENGTVVTEITYDYYDDMETLKKKTTKTYDADGNEAAEKEYYSEGGLITEKKAYENGTLVSRTEYGYDENGGLVSQKATTDGEETENE